jgi:hypothetical protein
MTARRTTHPAGRAVAQPGDEIVRRHVTQWRRATARLTVLANAGTGLGAWAAEAHALRRQCERLADELGHVADQARSHLRPDSARPLPHRPDDAPASR